MANSVIFLRIGNTVDKRKFGVFLCLKSNGCSETKLENRNELAMVFMDVLFDYEGTKPSVLHLKV